MAITFLAGAIVLEIIATSLLKTTEGFTKLGPTLFVLAAYGSAFYLLARSLEKGMQTGIAYALWAGIGVFVIATIGIIAFGEPVSMSKLAGIGLIIGGVITLNLAGAH